ncbi:MAG: diacylglycerol/lipid kinase family protein [Sphingosinicella sp.]
MRVRVIVNAGGGTLIGGGEDKARGRIEVAMDAAGVKAETATTVPEAIAAAFAEAAKAPGLDAVVAAGGDGTVSCAAGALADADRPLGILPLGTRNHLARDAGLPLGLEEAAQVIAAGHVRAIDVAGVNGHVFVNNSAVGLYPDMVRLRDFEESHGGRGRRRAMLSASLRALRSFKRRRLWISAPGIEAPVRTPLLFVGNNRYQVNLLALGRRETLDAGELSIHAVRARSRGHLLWAGLRGLFGRLDQQRDFVTVYAPEAEISSDRAALTIAADGETLRLETPLRYCIRPKALKLIVPAER